MNQKSDKEIIEEILDGEGEGLSLVVERYLKILYNFAFKLIGDKNEAEDIVQEVFLKVWKNLRKFDLDRGGENGFKTWILTIARNTTFDFLRRRKDISFSKLDARNENDENDNLFFGEKIPDLEPLPDEIFSRKELALKLEELLQQIRPDFREIIILHNTENLTFEEVSKIVSKPLNTVKSQYRRGLNSLRELLK